MRRNNILLMAIKAFQEDNLYILLGEDCVDVGAVRLGGVRGVINANLAAVLKPSNQFTQGLIGYISSLLESFLVA